MPFISKSSFFIIAFFVPLIGLAQNDRVVTGKVTEKSAKGLTPLVGAHVHWTDSLQGTFTSKDGSFMLKVPNNENLKLVFSYIGYKSDTLQYLGQEQINITLKPTIELGGVQIEARKNSTELSTIKIVTTETIGQKELLKAACCNLSESFETSASVNVAYSDAVTGAKEIQLLGLSGIYSQIMTEQIPNMRGLAVPFGLTYIPGPWMESIQVTKGSGSVANGYESTTGQINVEYLKPHTAPSFYVNGYAAESGNSEINLITARKVGKISHGSVMFHASNMPNQWDHNVDGFLDMPKTRNLNLLTRLSFNDSKRFEGQFVIKGINELRRGGQLDQGWSKELTDNGLYGIRIMTNRLEASSKTGMVFPEKPWKSVGLILSGSYHKQDSYFGRKTYDAQQGGFYGSMIFMSIFGTTNHKWKAGIDMRADFSEEFYMKYPYYKEEYVPGAYFEYTLDLDSKFGLIAGIRGDHHNEWGFFHTPRLHMKYNFTENIILRASAGKSFRTPNLFSDNLSMFASSRKITLYETLQPEKAWNYGANFTWKFRAFWREGSISLDYYITDFINQMIVDYYSYPGEIALYNLDGSSTSKSFQAAFNYEVFKRFDLRLAFKQDRVKTQYATGMFDKPLLPKYRGLINLAYATRTESWRFDFTIQLNGQSKLGVFEENSMIYHQGHNGHEPQVGTDNMTPNFITMNSQVTKVFGKKWEAYAGVENLTDFVQDLPVVGYDEPFGTEFDATNVWGPVMGRKIYIGFRYTLNQKTEQ
jgi:hypothetical protein